MITVKFSLLVLPKFLHMTAIQNILYSIETLIFHSLNRVSHLQTRIKTISLIQMYSLKIATNFANQVNF